MAWASLRSTMFAGFFLAQTMFASSICVVVTTEGPDYAPVNRVTVNVNSLSSPSALTFSAITDRKGTACADKIPDGVYSVEASSGGFMNVRYYPVRVAFPDDSHLTFRLPFAEVREGGLASSSTLSGTLKLLDRQPADGLKICLYRTATSNAVACTVTNDLGQYAMIVAPAVYRVEVSRLKERLSVSTIDLSHPGRYRDRVEISGRVQ